MDKKDLESETWDKKRIIIAVFVIASLFGAALFLKNIFFEDKNIAAVLPLSKLFETKVAGVNTKKDISSSNSKSIGKLKTDLQGRLDSVKKDVEGLTVSDVASSSPQLKKIIDDLQNLQKLPRNQAKEACYNICKGL